MRKFIFYCLCFLFIFTLKLNPISANTNLDDVEETIVSFMNDLYDNQLQHLNIVGSEIVIVKDGEIIYEQASGYEDLKEQKEVSLEETRFRIGSISKTFTAVAVMKLVEEGKIDLDENVNHYLSTFQIPDTFDEPITMRHLLTHTAGFDDKFMGLGAENWQDTEPLREHLEENMPKRIREPGKFFQYSNHGIALAGLIVEEVTGIPYDQYITEEILRPIGMNHTAVQLNHDVVPHLAKEYHFNGKDYEPIPLYGIHTYPAGAVVATGKDMATYMNVHLNFGEMNDVQITQPETAKLLYENQFSHHPNETAAFGFSFFIQERNGHRFVHHNGDTVDTAAWMILDHENNLGIYSVATGKDTNQFHQVLHDNFFYHYYPPQEVEHSLTATTTPTDLSQYEGEYVHNRISRGDLGKFNLLFGSTIKVKQVGNQLTRNGFEYVEVSPGFFADHHGNTIYFGDGYHSFNGNINLKVGFLESPTTHKMMLIISLAMIIVLTIIWVMNLIRKKNNSILAMVNGGLLISFLLFTGLLVYVFLTNSLILIVFMKLPWQVIVARPILYVSCLLWAVLGYHLIRQWKGLRVLSRVYYVLTLFSSSAFLVIMYYYNVI